ncbi:hypothetical protein [Sphingomonas sp. MA1305]|jgi:hypothetical protein|uniref:hypothetical protein n=1 Tax=Sphingomonas sp. MA1305 TaxID=2479204 RepID=UPI0018DF568A|nr:hypothetical protein [Sphingomonas sp. MA1305]
MEQSNREIAVAVGLMRMARSLLDREGQTHGAARLQQAIDTTLEERPLAPGEEVEPGQACLIAGIPLGGSPDGASITYLDATAKSLRR